MDAINGSNRRLVAINVIVGLCMTSSVLYIGSAHFQEEANLSQRNRARLLKTLLNYLTIKSPILSSLWCVRVKCCVRSWAINVVISFLL